MSQIQTHSSLAGLSPLLSRRPADGVPKESQVACEQDTVEWAGGVGFRSSEDQVTGPRSPRSELEAAQKSPRSTRGWSDVGRKVGLGAALAVTGLVGLSGVAQAQALPAQQVQQMVVSQTGQQAPMTLVQALQSSQPVRDTTPVRVSTVRDAVNQFSAQRQIYVVGNPQYQGRAFSSEDFARFQEVMREHPNAYVVLIEQSSNVRQDDYDLSRGIGNSAQFTSVVDAETGEKNGALFMIYFKVTDQGFIQRTGKDRAIYLRTESLLDEAGVGEGNFVDRETLQNRELMNVYVNAIQSGRDVPGALNSVMDRMDQGVQTYLNNTVQGAETKVNSAQEALQRVQPKVRQFQNQHGRQGELGNPDVTGWQSQIQDARSRLQQRDFAGAARIAQSVQNSIVNYEQAIGSFQNAPALAQEIQVLIQQAEQAIPGLPNNGPRAQAERNVQLAKGSLEQYRASHQANSSDYQTHLQAARTSAQSAVRNTEASRSQAEQMRNLKIYGSAALGGALLVTGLVLNHRARSRKGEANAALEEALEKVGDRSKELIRIMQQGSYEEISQYTGMTQKLANELIESTADSLALMGGSEKILAQAQDLIVGNTLGRRLENLFLRGNFNDAVALLTEPDKQVNFELADANLAKITPETPADHWRQQILASVPSREYRDSLLGVIERMGVHAQKNESIVTNIQSKSQEVGAYLDDIRKEGQQVESRSRQLQESGQADGLFVADSVTRRLLPTVLGDETQPGLLARGHEVKKSDPVRAWEEFGDSARRMTEDGDRIVRIGKEARTNLLPALESGDQQLHPHGVQTNWAHSKKKELSLDLHRAGERATQAPVGEQLQQIDREVARLQSRVETVVEQDQERREVSPGLIAEAESDVATARQGLCQALQAAGVFVGGTPDQVLREPDRDPTTLTQKSHRDLENVKPALDTGNIEVAGNLLANIRNQSAGAHQLVKQSREAFNSYTATAEERESRRENLSERLQGPYSDSLKRIRQQFAETAQAKVAPEVHNALTSKVATVGEYLRQAETQLESAGSLNLQAQGSYERAYLLTSRDQLALSDSQMRGAAANLEAVVAAEKRLGEHQQAAEKELNDLQSRVSSTQNKSKEHYVRRQAKDLVDNTRTQLEKARAAVQQKPADPYAAKEALASVEKLRKQAETAISSDHQAYESARSAIQSAERAIQSAESEIRSVASKSWSTYVSGYGSVSHSVSHSDLYRARSYADGARSEMSQSQSLMSRQDYEEAKRRADRARSEAGSAQSEAQRVERSEYSTYMSKVSSAKSQASSSSGGSSGGGSSGGGSGGGGGSGSTGGGW